MGVSGSGSTARLVAARAVMAVLDQGRALDSALASLLADFEAGRDRALVRRLSNGVLRSWPALNDVIGRLLDRPLRRRDREIHFLLAVALYELREQREPDHAVVHAAVAAARGVNNGRLSGLVNAVLRNFLRGRQEFEEAIAGDRVLKTGYPRWLIDRLEQDWPAELDTILQAGNQPPPMWLRVNRRRWSRTQARKALDEAGFSTRAPAQFPDALVLDERASVSALPGFTDGTLSVQDGAAQRVVDHLALEDGQRVLDACAAPGGKSAHILERCDVDLTAVDIDAERLKRVEETLSRLDLAARLITGDAACPETWWDGRGFDRILIDAPCSATGVIRRHPDIRWLRREADIAELTALQTRMVNALWPLLNPGGILVYATCSILDDENAGQARSFLEHQADARIIDHTDLPGRPVQPGRQMLPGDDDCDGFYYFSARRVCQ